MFDLTNILFEDGEVDDDLQEMYHGAFLILVHYLSNKKATRRKCHPRFCLAWDLHVARLYQESPTAFERIYRMSYTSYQKLCSWIEPYVRVDPIKSRNRTGTSKIETAAVLHCLVRWLAGGSYLDVRLLAGISESSFYPCCYKAVEAILRLEQLAIRFPTTPEAIEKSVQGFKEISREGIVDGCVACVDGFLVPITVPSSDETANQLAYYSGHYNTNGVNVQAACDSNCRFVYVAVAAPGSSSDLVALRKTSLSGMISGLPLGRYVIGNNAYVCTEHLLTPFPGTQRSEPEKNNYNFYLSQLRIRIEMTFGRFANRWRLFQRPVQVKLKNLGKLFMCAAMLHNFCEDERQRLPFGATFNGGDAVIPFPLPNPTQTVQGNSMMRDILVEQILHSGLVRTNLNLLRNGGVN